MPKCLANIDLLKGCKIKIYPNDEQKDKINTIIGIYRAVYNIGLNIQKENYSNGGSYISYFDMCKLVSNMRNDDPDYNWLNKVSMSTIRQSLVDLDHAFKNFFTKFRMFPKFKSKKHSKKSFMLRSDRIYIRDRYIGIPDLGNVYAKDHNIPLNTRVYNASLVFDGYYYWFTCQYEKENIYKDGQYNKSDPVGIDVGIRNMITTSNGDFYKFTDTSKYQKRLKRQQRRLQKSYDYYISESMRTKTKYEDIPKSKNMQKRLKGRFDTIQRIKNIRMNDIHTATRQIINQNPSAIVIEDIRTNDLNKNNPWIRSKTPCFGMIHQILKYKAKDRNIPVIVAKHNYPSSKICSRCGNIKKVHHSIYKCPVCGLKLDRDLNAAYNLKKLVYPEFNDYVYEVV